MSFHLAFDLGAQSGRAILGELSKGRLSISELHRFPTGITEIGNHLFWDIFRIFDEIKKGLKLCAEVCIPDSIGVDTWGVDFGLLGGSGELLELPYSYRDKRTEGSMESFFKKMDRHDIYVRTGIQLLEINTLFQLEAAASKTPETLSKADRLLFIPDIINYFLCGSLTTESTIASTSQIFNPSSKGWDRAIIDSLGLRPGLFPKIEKSGTIIGVLSEDISRHTSMPCIPVVSVASHDTASAVAAIPAAKEDWAYISSGTWSLMGIESRHPVINDTTYRLNFTNEGGVFDTIRILKNITGMWLIEECRRSWERRSVRTAHEELLSQAHGSEEFQAYIDTDHPLFRSPDDMLSALYEYCRRTDQKMPEGIGSVCRMIMEGLALKYSCVLEEIRQFSPHGIDRIHIVGGGSKNSLLCDFTAQATGIKVTAGPVEATAIGNILMQAAAIKGFEGINELRRIVEISFKTVDYLPGKCTGKWERAISDYKKFQGSII